MKKTTTIPHDFKGDRAKLIATLKSKGFKRDKKLEKDRLPGTEVWVGEVDFEARRELKAKQRVNPPPAKGPRG